MSIGKKIIYWIVVLLCASATLGMLSILIRTWDIAPVFHKCVKILVLTGWVYITYGALTLKFKCLRKLVMIKK